MVGYYRSFIPDFAGIATPLFNTLLNHQPDTITLTQKIQQSVDILKQQLCQYPILQFPNFNEPFILETDASDIRIAAILMQLQQGNKVIISCMQPAEHSQVQRKIMQLLKVKHLQSSMELNTSDRIYLADPSW